MTSFRTNIVSDFRSILLVVDVVSVFCCFAFILLEICCLRVRRSNIKKNKWWPNNIGAEWRHFPVEYRRFALHLVDVWPHRVKMVLPYPVAGMLPSVIPSTVACNEESVLKAFFLPSFGLCATSILGGCMQGCKKNPTSTWRLAKGMHCTPIFAIGVYCGMV